LTGTDARELVVPASLKEVDRVRRFLCNYLGGLGLKEEDELKIELALHEICVNIALYAYPEGRAGDPVKKPNPDVLARLRSGKRGGLGVFFFRTMMDGLSYRRDGGENILTVSKNI
jgi:anti-sigma regulatory factor (Ser/Thr protein kinase)